MVKKTGTLNTNQELMIKIKQTYNNLKILNQIPKNLTKSERFFQVAQKKKSGRN